MKAMWGFVTGLLVSTSAVWAGEAGEIALRLAQRGELKESRRLIDRALSESAPSRSARMAEAEWFFQKGETVQAFQVLEKALAKAEDAGLRRFQVKLLARAGATGRAFEMARAHAAVFSESEMEDLRLGLAERSLRWDRRRLSLQSTMRVASTPAAKALLEPMKSDPRARRLMVIAHLNEHQERKALREFSALKGDQPLWLRAEIAGLALKNGDLRFADGLLSLREGETDTLESKKLRLSLASRKGDRLRASRLLQELRNETGAESLSVQGVPQENWARFDVEMEEPWIMVADRRLEDAVSRFSRWSEAAPLNAHFVSSRGELLRWNGRPRSALAEQAKARVLDPEMKSFRWASSQALMDLHQFKEAEALTPSEETLGENRFDLIDLSRRRRLLRSPHLEFSSESAQSGLRQTDLFTETRLASGLISSDWPLELFAGARTKREGGGSDRSAATLPEAGAKLFLPSATSLSLGARSLAVGQFQRTAGFASLEAGLSDSVHSEIFYEGLDFNLPAIALESGISSSTLGAKVEFHAGEGFRGGVSLSRSSMSDGNQRRGWSLNVDQRLFASATGETRVSGGYGSSQNTMTGTSYFNPSRDQFAFVQFQQVWSKDGWWSRNFAQTLRAGGGIYAQETYAQKPTSWLGYAHEWEFDQGLRLGYGAEYRQSVYDGVESSDLGFQLSLSLPFSREGV